LKKFSGEERCTPRKKLLGLEADHPVIPRRVKNVKKMGLGVSLTSSEYF